MARYPRNEINSSDFEIGQQSNIKIPLTGEIITEDHSFDVIDADVIKGDYAALLAFNEEPVTVVVHETTNENEIQMPAVYVNGRSQYFIRGVPVTVRRKFVEGLVRTKPINVRTKVTMRNVGEEPINELVRTSATLYPFSIIEDKNPNGAAWLRKLMAEA